jgi:hypothetical protein
MTKNYKTSTKYPQAGWYQDMMEFHKTEHTVFTSKQKKATKTINKRQGKGYRAN